MKTTIFLLGTVLGFAVLTIDAASVHVREKRHHVVSPGFGGDYWSGPQIGGGFGGLTGSESSAGSKSIVRRDGSGGESHTSSNANSYSQGSSGSESGASSNSASNSAGNGAYSSSNSWSWASG